MRDFLGISSGYIQDVNPMKESLMQISRVCRGERHRGSARTQCAENYLLHDVYEHTDASKPALLVAAELKLLQGLPGGAVCVAF